MVIYIYEYYSSLKKNKITKFPGKCMNLEWVVLSTVTQFKKERNFMFSIYMQILAKVCV